MISKIKLNISALILGLTSMVGQIIIIRELIVVFYGNELSLGIILASWLFWVAVGSFILGRLVDWLPFKEKLLSYIYLIISILLPLNIFLIRIIKSILKIPTGELIGFVPMFGASFLSLSIICTLLGFTFTLISKLSAEKSTSPSTQIGKIYLLEGLGAGIGGILYSFFLIRAFGQFQNILIVAGMNLLTSILFNRNITQLVYLLILILSFIFHWPVFLDRFTRNLQFSPFKVIETTDTIYGNITVTKRDSQFSFYENGLLMFTSSDFLTSEESVHYAMLEHPFPKRVLLIGGGVGGSLHQILKHNVNAIDYVELDPMVIELSEKYLGPIKDKRINIINTDGRAFVKQNLQSKFCPASHRGASYRGARHRGEYATNRSIRRNSFNYDVIILNLPDPYTAMLNRFYSLEFFRELKKILAPEGLLSFGLTSSENYISPENAIYLASIYRTLEKGFSDIKILPGDRVSFIATNRAGLLTYNTNILIKRLKERKISTKFVQEYYLPFKLHPLRIKYIETSIKDFKLAKINTDFKPIGYLYHMVLWMSVFDATKHILPYLQFINIYLLSLILMLFLAFIFLIQKLTKPSFKMPVVLSIGATGVSEICFQLIVILAFQFIYGYVYYKIGIILTSFMIGLVLGSFFINRTLETLKDERRLYIKTQYAICLYPLILLIILTCIAKINEFRPTLVNALQSSFVFLPIIAGFIGGFQFPLANKICLESSQDVGKTTGLLYGVDVLGACIGGLLAGIILIPLLGIVQTCVLLSVINTFVLVLLSISHRAH